MCKQRWRPYIKPSPQKIIDHQGESLGQAIIQNDIEAISEAAIRANRWITLVGGVVFLSPTSGPNIPTIFDNPFSGEKWLLGKLPELDLHHVKCIERSVSRIAHLAYSALLGETTVAEIIMVTPENEAILRQKYLKIASSFQQKT